MSTGIVVVKVFECQSMFVTGVGTHRKIIDEYVLHMHLVKLMEY